jgi:hypothetical protein
MFHRLGVDWAGSLLGFLAIAFLPIPFLFYIYGERLRKHSPYAPTNFGKQTGPVDEESTDAGAEEDEERTRRNTEVEGMGMAGEREKVEGEM